MIEEKLIDLINGALDGVNSPGEDAELEACLESDSEARHYFEELKDLAQKLQSVARVKPPKGFEAVVTKEAIASHRGYIGRAQPGRVIRGRKRGPRAAWFVAAALVLGIGLGAFLTAEFHEGSAVNLRRLQGTIINERDLASGKASALEAPGLRGWIRSYRPSPGRMLVEFEVSTESEILLTLSHDPEIGLSGYRNMTNTGQAMEVVRGEIRLIQDGKGRYVFEFARPGESSISLDLRAYAGGKLILDRSVPQGGN